MLEVTRFAGSNTEINAIRHRGRLGIKGRSSRAAKFVTAALVVTSTWATGPGAQPAAASPERNARAQAVLDRLAEPGMPRNAVMAALADGTINIETPTLAPGQLAPAPVEVGYVIEGSDLSALDVTRTVEGQAEIAAFVKSLLADGLEEAASRSFTVYSLPAVTVDSDVNDTLHPLPIDTGPVDSLSEGEGPLSNALVVPGCDVIAAVGAVATPTGLLLSTVLETAPQISLATDSYCEVSPPNVLQGGTPADSMTGGPGDSDQWTAAGGLGCMRRKSNNTAWYDPCSFWYHRTGRVNGKEVWGLKQWGTGKSKGVNDLKSLEARSWRVRNTATQTWNDWGPKSDSDQGNCVTTTVGVNVQGAVLEQSAEHCDKWDIDKGSAAASFANTWRGSAHRSERATDAVIATSTNPGEAPHDYVRYDYEAAWWY